jgi:hypothetical protein
MLSGTYLSLFHILICGGGTVNGASGALCKANVTFPVRIFFGAFSLTLLPNAPSGAVLFTLIFASYYFNFLTCADMEDVAVVVCTYTVHPVNVVK